MVEKDFNIESNLLLALKQGECEAYNFLFHKFHNNLCVYVLKLCHDEALAKDIVQTVFINFWNKRKSITIRSSLKNYLYTSAHHAFLEHTRMEKRKCSMLEQLKWEALLDSQIHLNDKSILEQRIEKVNAAIESLPPKCRQAFELSKFEKLKHKEIAEIMSISTKTVEHHISKAFSILRKVTTLFFW